jgi:voltage-gated potassium channel
VNQNPLFQIKVIVGTLVLLICGGTALFHYLEPSFTFIQAFYFTVTTMTTVGYGDLTPTSDLTRLAVSIYILVAVSLYVSLITHFGSHYLAYHNNRAKRKKTK